MASAHSRTTVTSTWLLNIFFTPGDPGPINGHPTPPFPHSLGTSLLLSVPRGLLLWTLHTRLLSHGTLGDRLLSRGTVFQQRPCLGTCTSLPSAASATPPRGLDVAVCAGNVGAGPTVCCCGRRCSERLRARVCFQCITWWLCASRFGDRQTFPRRPTSPPAVGHGQLAPIPGRPWSGWSQRGRLDVRAGPGSGA